MISIHDSQWKVAYLEAHPYEKERWFYADDVEIKFFMIRNFLTHFLARVKSDAPASSIDVGFGVGTWSEIFANAWRTTTFDLVGSDEKSLEFARKRFGAYSHVQSVAVDFLHYAPGKVYDFFFSTTLLREPLRVVKNLQHMNLMLSWGGESLLMVETPAACSSWRSRHRFVEDMKISCIRAGMQVLRVYPVVCMFPGVRSVTVNVALSRIAQRFSYAFYMAPCVETFAIYCKKT